MKRTHEGWQRTKCDRMRAKRSRTPLHFQACVDRLNSRVNLLLHLRFGQLSLLLLRIGFHNWCALGTCVYGLHPIKISAIKWNKKKKNMKRITIVKICLHVNFITTILFFCIHKARDYRPSVTRSKRIYFYFSSLKLLSVFFNFLISIVIYTKISSPL